MEIDDEINVDEPRSNEIFFWWDDTNPDYAGQDIQSNLLKMLSFSHMLRTKLLISSAIFGLKRTLKNNLLRILQKRGTVAEKAGTLEE